MAASGNNTTPFFGCKISLISKSEIRYEGILYTIDPKESTIALAKVRSFGSEDRPVERPVPPRDDIFEFIIFRASDIKDLIVDDPPPAPVATLTDPAIVQAQHGGSGSTSFPSSFGQSSINASAPAAAAPQAAAQPSPLQQLQQQAAKAPGAIPKTSQPSADASVETSKPSTSKPSASVAPGQAFAKVAAGLSGAGQQKQPGQRQQNQQPFNKQNQLKSDQPQQPGARLTQQQAGQQLNAQQGQNGFGNRQPRQNNQQNRVIGEGANPNFHRNGPQQQQGFRQYNANRFQPRHQQQQGGPGGYRGRGGFGQRNFMGHRPMQHQNALKFTPLPDGEFDFEKSHEEFKKFEEELIKGVSALKMNGSTDEDVPIEIPGIPASAIAVAALEEQEMPKEDCYNKTKSFFDSISCEALEREKGANNRVDWKAERKQNRETFGVVSARRPTYFQRNNRGGYGGGYGNYHHGGRAGFHQQRGSYHHYQNRTGGGQRDGGNRGPRTPNPNQANGNGNVTSTTPNSRSGPKSTANGVSSTGGSAVPAKN